MLDMDLSEFDESGNDHTPTQPQKPRPVLKTVVKTQEAESAVTVDAQAMEEVEFRLELAQYYRLVLSMDSFFNDAFGAAATVVDKEIRDFVRGRMSKLVGIGPGTNDSGFTPAEVTALKALAAPNTFAALSAIAAKVTKKPALAEATVAPTPTLRKVEAPAKPSVRKVSAKSIPPSQPVAPPTAPEPGPEPEPEPVEVVAQVKRVTKTKTVIAPMIGPDGKTVEKEVVMDLSQQARPVGNIQPIPFPTSKRQTEMMSQMTAARLADANNREASKVIGPV